MSLGGLETRGESARSKCAKSTKKERGERREVEKGNRLAKGRREERNEGGSGERRNEGHGG